MSSGDPAVAASQSEHDKITDPERIPKISALFRLGLTGILLITLLVNGDFRFFVSGVLFVYLVVALVSALFIFRGIHHPARLAVIASFDVLMVSYFSWGIGALSSPVAVLYLPLVIAFSVQKNAQSADGSWSFLSQAFCLSFGVAILACCLRLPCWELQLRRKKI